MLRPGSRVLIAPNARLHRFDEAKGDEQFSGDGYLPHWADERGTVVKVAPAEQPPNRHPGGIAFYRPRYGSPRWVKVLLDHVTYPAGEALEVAWIRSFDLTELSAIDALAEIVQPHSPGEVELPEQTDPWPTTMPW